MKLLALFVTVSLTGCGQIETSDFYKQGTGTSGYAQKTTTAVAAEDGEIRKVGIIGGLTCASSVDSMTAYSSPDRDRPGDIWIFGKRIGDRMAYIKLKIWSAPDGRKNVTCISFHEASYTMRFPFA